MSVIVRRRRKQLYRAGRRKGWAQNLRRGSVVFFQEAAMTKMRVIVVGGFLGAGKTTLLAQAAKHFARQGKQVGIITNDQAADLVDTRLLAGLGVAVGEVAGGCFCCRFEDLERTARSLLRDNRPDVLLSEPVGSCVDISATVLQPMKRHWGEWAEISPFSVLADARLLDQILSCRSSLPDSVRYIIKKQFEEADCIVVNKADLLSRDLLAALKAKIASAWRGAHILEMSALNDLGVAEWIEMVSRAAGGGGKILDVDYDLYASGEAELGWLNASISLTAREETDWNAFARDLIGRIQADLAGRSAEIGHLKLLLSNLAGQVALNITGMDEKPSARGGIPACAGVTTLVINARARVEPEVLKAIVKHSLEAAASDAITFPELDLCSFKPAYPRPTHRMDEIVPPTA
jgi:Ni2+-binding GTPase involved in maturation of urease and hydrogenase